MESATVAKKNLGSRGTTMLIRDIDLARETKSHGLWNERRRQRCPFLLERVSRNKNWCQQKCRTSWLFVHSVKGERGTYHCPIPVSYTHLDVYKRQTMTLPDNLDSPSVLTPKENGTSPIGTLLGNGNFTNKSNATLKPCGLIFLASSCTRYFFCKPKKPLIGSEAVVNGLAMALAPEEMTLRYNGQSLSIPTPGAYLVPKTNGCFLKLSNNWGTLSGGCCKSASMQIRYSPLASWKPFNLSLIHIYININSSGPRPREPEPRKE